MSTARISKNLLAVFFLKYFDSHVNIKVPRLHDLTWNKSLTFQPFMLNEPLLIDQITPHFFGIQKNNWKFYIVL